MSKIFLDFGANRGQALKHFIIEYKIDSGWIVESFEPNPLCKTEEYLDISFVKFHNKAVWDRNGTVSFSQMLEDSQGSSVNCLMDDDACLDPNNISYRYHQSIIEVDCVDVSDILNQYDNNDFIVVKIDVEGAEFVIIRKMIIDGTIEKINHLYVEWHTKYLSSETFESETELKKSITDAGINLRDWH